MNIINDPTRRDVLTATGAMLTVGCLERGTDDDESFDTHPATDDVGDTPTLGPEPGTAEGTIVAFEDPSCSSCAAFASDTLPKLRENAIDTGQVSYVWRATPVVEPWGRPATRALWAVWQDDSTGFWALKSRYYAERDSIDADNIRHRTRTFLADGVSSADPKPVLAAIDGDDSSIQDRIERDNSAAEKSDISAVPAFVLFREGDYVTIVTGNQSYGVFKGALEL